VSNSFFSNKEERVSELLNKTKFALIKLGMSFQPKTMPNRKNEDP